MKRTNILAATLVAALVGGSVVHADFIAGDAILVNFSKNGTTVGGNWNEITRPSGQFIPTGTQFANLTKFSGGPSDVSLSLAGVDLAGIGGLDVPFNSFSFPGTGAIPTNAVTNLTYNNPQATWTFGGLDASLEYTISILNSHVGGANVAELDWTINGRALAIDGDGADGNGIGGVFTLSGIQVNGSNEIVLVSSADGTQHINALELTAIPEPATAGLLGLAGLVLLKRRRVG